MTISGQDFRSRGTDPALRGRRYSCSWTLDQWKSYSLPAGYKLGVHFSPRGGRSLRADGEPSGEGGTLNSAEGKGTVSFSVVC